MQSSLHHAVKQPTVSALCHFACNMLLWDMLTDTHTISIMFATVHTHTHCSLPYAAGVQPVNTAGHEAGCF